MAKYATTTELRKMSAKDLQQEIREAKIEVAKLRMGVRLQKEKDTAKYEKERKQVARMETILSEKLSNEVKEVSSPDKTS